MYSAKEAGGNPKSTASHASVDDGVMQRAVSEAADWVDVKDPNVIAETELLQAAASIEAAAKKLAELKPTRTVEATEDLNFEEQIWEAAKNIASSTSALVKSASAVQRELVAQGKLSSNPKHEDSQWSDGLVSAAKYVAQTTGNLCDAANGLVQGNAEEDKLIAAAKSVASSTAQLLMACQVKADARSQSNKNLLMAGAAVKKATDTLVKAAQQAAAQVEDKPKVKPGVMPKFKEELEAQEKIAKMQRELEKVKEQLHCIRSTRKEKSSELGKEEPYKIRKERTK